MWVEGGTQIDKLKSIVLKIIGVLAILFSIPYAYAVISQWSLLYLLYFVAWQIGGWGLLINKSWSRVLLVLISLINFWNDIIWDELTSKRLTNALKSGVAFIKLGSLIAYMFEAIVLLFIVWVLLHPSIKRHLLERK